MMTMAVMVMILDYRRVSNIDFPIYNNINNAFLKAHGAPPFHVTFLDPSSKTNPHSYLFAPQEVMHHPVFAADGYSYERAAIVEWFRKSNLSPMTDIRLPHTDIVPNHALKAMIQEHLRRRG